MIAQIFAGLIIGYIFTLFYEQGYNFVHRNVKKDPMINIRGFHFHHSLYGIFSFIIATFLFNLFLFGFGAGIVWRHTYQDGFRFIDKNKEKPKLL
jgi:hypothetical protein